MKVGVIAVSAVSEEQLSALLAKLKEDTGLQEKLKGAADIDAAVLIAKEAGFEVSRADLLNHQANRILELGEEDLEGLTGGRCLPNTYITKSTCGLSCP